MGRAGAGTVHIRQASPATVKPTVAAAKAAAAAQAAAAAAAANANAMNVVPASTPTTVTHIKVGSTQIKPIINTSNASIIVPSPVIVSSTPTNISSTSVISATAGLSTVGSTALASLAPPVPLTQPTPLPIPTVATIATAPPTTLSTTITTAPSSTPATTKSTTAKGQTPSQLSATAKASAASKDKERKASASFYQQSSMSASMYGDDDINDVAAMGGVNLAEESQRILGSTELIGRQIRSCKDEIFLHMPSLLTKIRSIIAKHGLEEPTSEVAVLVSHACQERLKNIVEKLAVIAEHRIDIIKVC